MAEAREPTPDEGTGTVTVTETELSDNGRSPTLHLKLEKKPDEDKKVKWEEGTVDNEFMNKKKSKCCCIYEKPKTFGESSSSDSEDECDHCRGHKKKCYKKRIGPSSDDHSHEDSDKPVGPSNGAVHD